MGYAATCYDPNYDSYYNCAGDEYIAPINAAALFGAIIYNNNGYQNHRDYNHRNHGGYYDNRKHY
jgi:hypothetical protein